MKLLTLIYEKKLSPQFSSIVAEFDTFFPISFWISEEKFFMVHFFVVGLLLFDPWFSVLEIRGFFLRTDVTFFSVCSAFVLYQRLQIDFWLISLAVSTELIL